MKHNLAIILLLLFFTACKNKKVAVVTDPGIYYTCSMDPQIKENKPGKCPICKMDLTIAKKSTGSAMDEIELSEQQMQLGNILMDTIRNGSVGDQVVLSATVNSIN